MLTKTKGSAEKNECPNICIEKKIMANLPPNWKANGMDI